MPRPRCRSPCCARDARSGERRDRRVGGDQIDYIDEKPEIRRLFATELAKHGIAPRMDAAYAKEETELGVKTA